MTAHHRPTPVLTADDVREQFSTADGLLVALDFDGTLAPIADDPDAPTITQSNRQALLDLVGQSQSTVAVVSGRQLSDLRPRVGIDGVRYVGNHGLEYTVDGDREIHPEASASRAHLEQVYSDVATRLDHLPGLEIEDKQLTLTVHYRRVADDHTDDIHSTVEEIVSSVDDLRTTAGRQIVEVRPDIDWDKGRAVEWLADDVAPEWPAVYVGDDTTDEDAFQTLGESDLSILVGDRETAASYRIERQRDVAAVITWLTETVENGT